LMHMVFNEVTYSTTRSQVSRLYFVPILAILNISLHTCMMYRSVDARTPRFLFPGTSVSESGRACDKLSPRLAAVHWWLECSGETSWTAGPWVLLVNCHLSWDFRWWYWSISARPQHDVFGRPKVVEDVFQEMLHISPLYFDTVYQRKDPIASDFMWQFPEIQNFIANLVSPRHHNPLMALAISHGF